MNPITLATPALTNATSLQLLDAAAAAGFDGVGLRLSRSRLLEQPFYPVLGNTALISRIKRKIADTGLFVLELYSFYVIPEFDFDAFEEAMEVGAELGAKYAVVLGYDPDAARARDTFARMCDIGEPLGMTMTVEFAPMEQCQPATLEQALKFLQDAGRNNCAVMPDPAHLLRSGGSISDLRTIDRRFLRFSQITDLEIIGDEFLPILGRRAPKFRRRPLGEGMLPVSEWMDALPEGLPISVECVPQPQGTSHTDWAKTLCTTTRNALKRYYEARRAGPGERGR